MRKDGVAAGCVSYYSKNIKHFPSETMNSFVFFFLLYSSFFLWCATFSDAFVFFVQMLLVLVICCGFVLYVGLFFVMG